MVFSNKSYKDLDLYMFEKTPIAPGQAWVDGNARYGMKFNNITQWVIKDDPSKERCPAARLTSAIGKMVDDTRVMASAVVTTGV